MRSKLLILTLLVGCSASDSSSESTSPREIAGKPPSLTLARWGGLKVQFSGNPLAEARDVLILLHGYGASSSDLMPLANEIGGESRAYIFPEAPVVLESGGSAWATSKVKLAASRKQIVELVTYVQSTHPKIRISIGGFSQGATLASTLAAEDGLNLKHLVLFSPALALDESAPTARHRPVIFLSHGRADRVLPFSDSERLREILTRKGYKVNWRPFDGGHTITLELLDATRQLLNERG